MENIVFAFPPIQKIVRASRLSRNIYGWSAADESFHDILIRMLLCYESAATDSEKLAADYRCIVQTIAEDFGKYGVRMHAGMGPHHWRASFTDSELHHVCVLVLTVRQLSRRILIN